MKTLELTISGMTCSECSKTIENELLLEGIISKNVDYGTDIALVTYDEQMIDENIVIETVNRIGQYKVEESQLLIQDYNILEQHLIIIGGGSAAFSATIQAKEYGIRVTMINDGLPIGGTCVNVGCVPSKNLMRAAETLYKAKQNPFRGIQSSASLEDFKMLISEKQSLVLDLREKKYISIIKDMDDFEFIEGHASLLSGTSVKVGRRVIEGSHILIATGAKPMIVPIKGLEDIPYLTNEEAFELETLPASMIVVGGSYVALEIAQLFSRLGSKVTVLQRSNHLLSTEHTDIGNALSNYFKEEGMQIITSSIIESVSSEDGNVLVKVLVGGKEEVFSAEKILMATGRQANTSNINFKSVGICLDKNNAIIVDDFMRTSIDTVYAAGDVLGKNMFVYTAAYEAKIAIDNAFGRVPKKADFSVLPWVIFTDPQVAGVGLDEEGAEAKGIDYEVAILPLSYVPRAIAAQDTRGFIKLLRNKEDDTLLGARILAPEGSELLMEISLAIKYGIKVSDLKEMLHPYLTMAEGIKLAAITFSKDIKELSCCAT